MYKVTLIFIAILGCMVAGSSAFAQETESRKIYVISDITVHDRETYAEYQEKAAPLIKKFGGRYLIRSGAAEMNKSPEDNIILSTGDWNPDRLIILEFDSIEQGTRFFESPEYTAIAPIREGASSGRAIFVREYK